MSSSPPETPELSPEAGPEADSEARHTTSCSCARCLIVRYGEDGALLNPSPRPGHVTEYGLEVLLDRDGERVCSSYGLVSSLEEITTVCMPRAAADAAARGEKIVEQFVAVYLPYYRLTTQPIPDATDA